MEPLTAFGLACNVMKVVSFGHEIFSLAQRIVKDGSPDTSLIERCTHISKLSKDLRDSLQKHQSTRPPTERDQRLQEVTSLQEVANKCLSVAENLAEELEKIKWKTEHSSSRSNQKKQRKLWIQIWRAWLGKAKIDKLHNEMTELQKSLQSTILVDLWSTQEAAALLQRQEFKSLQQLIEQLKDLVENQAATIKEDIRSETRVHVSDRLQAQEAARPSKKCKVLLRSLTFESMNYRTSQIAECHENTFQWIFDDKVFHKWASFSQWLRSDQRIYWISGKAGSGKSTLMKFLVHNQQTRDDLDKWRTNTAIISFFLWNAGNPLQRSVKGLLCSLLHQLLMTEQSPIAGLIAAQPVLLSKKNHGDWSDIELEQVLVQGMSMRPVCVFLDGLDEIEQREGFDYLVKLIDRLQSKSSAKFCISSRPELALKHAFRSYPQLQLQDLTKPDISSFVASSLSQPNFPFWDENVEDEKKRQKIVDEVVRRAQGVFLWVHLVVKSLHRGTGRCDNCEQLLKWIEKLPKTLEDFYKEAWARLGEDESLYREEAAGYFRLALRVRELHFPSITSPFSLFDFYIASDDEIQKTFLDDKIIPPVTILLRDVKKCRQRVESCCGGLLEFWEPKNETGNMYMVLKNRISNFFSQFLLPLSAYVTTDPSIADPNIPQGSDLVSLWNIFYNVKVDFIHRTAVDFLLETDSGRTIIDSDQTSPSNITAKFVRSQIIRHLLFGYTWHRSFSHPIKMLQYRDTIPDEMRHGLQILVEDTCHRFLDRASVIEFIINKLRLHIRDGQFDGSFYRILCDFINSMAAEDMLPFPERRNTRYVDASVVAWTKNCQTYEMVNFLPNACNRILANYKSTTDLWRDVKWPVEIPKIEVLFQADVSPDILWDRILAHLLFTTWILVDARRCLRYCTAEKAIKFLRGVVGDGLVEVAQRWFNARPGPYDGIPHFKEMLLYDTESTPEMQELLERLLQSGVMVADPAHRLDGRSDESLLISIFGYRPAITNHSKLYEHLRKNQKAIYKAIVSGLAESDDSEYDGVNFEY